MTMTETNEHTNEKSKATETYRVLALYKFVSPLILRETLKTIQSDLDEKCRSHHCRGTLLVAEEGVNGTICYPYHKESKSSSPCGDDVLQFIQDTFGGGLRIRISSAPYPVFTRMKIKVKSEIVSMHRQDLCNPTECVGRYVKPSNWNELLLDPECLVIDTRNDYEVQVGTFRNAVNPQTESFTEFPDWMKNQLNLQDDTPNNKAPKKIAMFCTGGIRCEKATSACLKLVPKDVPVFHLEGGILGYLDEIPAESSLFEGECYVFDQRIAVTNGLTPSTTYSSSCYACRHPLSRAELERDDFVQGLHCRWCVDQLTEKQKERFEARQRQIELAKHRGEVHIHDPKELVVIASR